MNTPILPPVLPGDYNSNAGVNAADYVAWRKFFGTSAVLPNDTTPDSVAEADFNVWVSGFGASSAGSAPLTGGGLSAFAQVPRPMPRWPLLMLNKP